MDFIYIIKLQVILFQDQLVKIAKILYFDLVGVGDKVSGPRSMCWLLTGTRVIRTLPRYCESTKIHYIVIL